MDDIVINLLRAKVEPHMIGSNKVTDRVADLRCLLRMLADVEYFQEKLRKAISIKM